MNKKIVEIGLVAAILLFAGFVRFWGLDCFPPGLYPDEAVNATDGLVIAEQGGWEWFYENNNGREGLYLNLLGYLLHWLGPEVWVLRLLPALIGFLTLPAVYWLGRRWISPVGGIVSLMLVSFSFWHINFSRVGFRAILMVLLLTWAFALITEAFHRLTKDKSKFNLKLYWLYFALGGVFLGLSLHTYIAVRITPVVLFALWAGALFLFPALWKKILVGLAVMSVFAIFTASPLLLDFLNNPEHFSGRTSDVSVMSSSNIPATLIKTVSLTLISFLAYGDQNWRHNYPLHPVIFPFWGMLMFSAIGWGIYQVVGGVIRKIRKKNIAGKEKWKYLSLVFLISWWGFFLLPSVMTNEGLPHALRSIGSLIPAYILIGFIVSMLMENRKKVRVFLIVVLVLTAFYNSFTYFYLWGGNSAAKGAFEYRLVGIGEYLKEGLSSVQSFNYYVLANQDAVKTDSGYPVSIETIRFVAWEDRGNYEFILPSDFRLGSVKYPAAVIIQKEDKETVDFVKEIYPRAVERKIEIGEYMKDCMDCRCAFQSPNSEFNFTVLEIRR